MGKPKSTLHDLSQFWKKNHRELLASLSLAATTLFFPPLSIFAENVQRLNLRLVDVLYFYGFVTLIVSAVLAGFSLLMKRFFSAISIIYVSIGYCILLQGTFLAYDIGSMDGRDIAWDTFQHYYWIEGLLWGTAIISAIVFRKKLLKNLVFAMALLMFAEFAILLSANILNQDKANVERSNSVWFVDYGREFEFSSDKNVVIIVVDTFRSHAFDDALVHEPSLHDAFKDFTFYENTISNFPNTYASIPSILTGIPYKNQTSTAEYLEAAFAQSLPILLRKQGIEAEIYPLNSTTLVSYPNVWDNVDRPVATQSNSLRLMYYSSEKLSLLSSIRYSPLLLKPYFVSMFYQASENNLIEQDDHQNSAIQFYQNSNRTSKTDRKAVFKFIHLPGVHPPFVMDDTFTLGQYPSTYNSYVKQAVANLVAVANLLENLKKTDAYDNSLIIIMGDHGIQPFAEEYTSKSIQNITRNRPLFLNNWLPYVGTPLFLVKNFDQEQDRILRSSAPLMLSDVPKMVAESLNIEHGFGGLNPLTENIPQKRERYFYFYDAGAHKWGDTYMPTLFEYLVQGPADDASSWRYTGKVYNPKKIEPFSPPKYQYGNDFLNSELFDQFARFISDGFHKTDQGAWAMGPISCLHLPVEESNNPLYLSFTASPFLAQGKLLQQEMSILADNQFVTTIQLTAETNSTTVQLGADLTHDQELKLCFEFPDAKHSLMELGINNDPRHPGGLFRSLSVGEFRTFPLPVQFDFGKDGNANIIKSTGWSYPESGFSWSAGHNSQLVLPLAVEDIENIKMTISAFPLINEGSLKEQLVIIRSGNHELGRWMMDHDGEYTVDIPSRYVSDGILAIEFEIPNATSPADLGINQDIRVLGMAVRWLRVEQP